MGCAAPRPAAPARGPASGPARKGAAFVAEPGRKVNGRRPCLMRSALEGSAARTDTGCGAANRERAAPRAETALRVPRRIPGRARSAIPVAERVRYRGAATSATRAASGPVRTRTAQVPVSSSRVRASPVSRCRPSQARSRLSASLPQSPAPATGAGRSASSARSGPGPPAGAGKRAPRRSARDRSSCRTAFATGRFRHRVPF